QHAVRTRGSYRCRQRLRRAHRAPEPSTLSFCKPRFNYSLNYSLLTRSCTIEAMQQKKALVFVGMPGAGKSVCVEYLKEKGLPSSYFGGITLEELKKRGLEVNEANERFVREDIRAKEGKGAYALRIITQVKDQFDDGHDCVVVDGLYSWTEYKIFKE